MISLCWKRANVLLDADYDELNTYRNFNIREHFLTKLYALASFRKVRSEDEVSGLVQFHEANKFLLTAHSQKESRILGNIVANHEGLNYAKQSALYREHLAKAFNRPPKVASKANVFMHSLGYFKDKLSLQEKEHFLQSIERYKNKKIPSTALLAMLQSWTARFDEEYVKNQTIFEPFPEELVELCRDSQCEWAGEELFLGRGG